MRPLAGVTAPCRDAREYLVGGRPLCQRLQHRDFNGDGRHSPCDPTVTRDGTCQQKLLNPTLLLANVVDEGATGYEHIESLL